MPYIKINQVNYFYRLEGEGDPVVLIAGYSCDHTFWDGVFDLLIKKYRVLAFDNRAVGRTEDDGAPLNMELMADETVQLFQALAISNPHLIGHSMGGMIAQIIGKKHSIRTLILLNTTGKTNARTLMVMENLLKLIEEKVRMETVIEASLPWFFSPSFLADRNNIEAIKKRMMDNPYPQSLKDLKRQFNALKAFDISRFPALFKAPAFVIASQEDIICLPEEMEGEKKMVEGGHSTPLEIPQAITAAIVEFLVS